MNSNVSNNIFLQIENSDNKTLFLYGLILIVALYLFQKIFIGLNIIFGICLGVLLIMYLNTRYQKEETETKEIYDNKLKYIRPKPKKISSYPLFIDFLFSIQDFYQYNVPAYEDMIDSIDDILELYEESKITPSTAGLNYGLVDNERKEAVNSLHSIIFNVPNDNQVIDVLNEAIEKLNTMLYDLMDQIYSYHKLYIFNNGYNRNTVEIIRGPKPENFYDQAPFSFDLF